jgi:hypothetical protein
MNVIYQSDDARGNYTTCDGRAPGVETGPDPGPGVLSSEDFLFWPLPEGEWYLKIDATMPDKENGSKGDRIFCLEITQYLDYYL